MSRAAFTRCDSNLELLNNWLRYYTQYFDDVTVIGTLPMDNLEETVKKHNANYIELETTIYHPNTYQFIFDKQKDLFNNNEWVLYSDLDEIIVPDPKEYRDLSDFMDRYGMLQSYCEGFDVSKTKEESYIDWSKPILEQRSMWAKDLSGSYNKPLLSRITTPWREGFHSLNTHTDELEKKIHDTGLYLFHLRWINGDSPDRCDKPVKIPESFKGLF